MTCLTLSLETINSLNYESAIIAQFQDNLLVNKKRLDMKSSNYKTFRWSDLRIIKDQKLLIAWYVKPSTPGFKLALMIMDETLNM